MPDPPPTTALAFSPRSDLIPLPPASTPLQDKPLRQQLFRHIVADLKAANRKTRNERLNRAVQVGPGPTPWPLPGAAGDGLVIAAAAARARMVDRTLLAAERSHWRDVDVAVAQRQGLDVD